MIIDSSALLAILLEEPEADRLTKAIMRDPVCVVSVANWLELSMVAFQRGGEEAVRDLDVLAVRHRLEIASVTPRHGDIARRGFMRYGKGIHPAALNFGDCFAYALSKDTGEKLLFKGGDFEQTDVERAPY
jgi:ribonuclease VapC